MRYLKIEVHSDESDKAWTMEDLQKLADFQMSLNAKLMVCTVDLPDEERDSELSPRRMVCTMELPYEESLEIPSEAPSDTPT